MLYIKVYIVVCNIHNVSELPLTNCIARWQHSHRALRKSARRFASSFAEVSRLHNSLHANSHDFAPSSNGENKPFPYVANANMFGFFIPLSTLWFYAAFSVHITLHIMLLAVCVFVLCNHTPSWRVL